MAKSKVTFAEGVEPAPGNKLSPEMAKALKAKAKIRISIMIDEDILLELKRLASLEGNKKYQTMINDILRGELFGLSSDRTRLSKEQLLKLFEELDRRQIETARQVNEIKKMVKQKKLA